jgi:ribonuclease HI
MGELMAVLDLLRATAEVDEPLRILCDSQYVINCCTRWIPAWKKRGWRKSDNKPVLNADLLKPLDEALAGRRVNFQWVRGHTGHPLNEMADTLARAAATAYRDGTPVKSGPGYGLSEPIRQPEPAPDGPPAAEHQPVPVPVPARRPEPVPEPARTKGTTGRPDEQGVLDIPLPDPVPPTVREPPEPRAAQPARPSLPDTVRRPEPDPAVVVDLTELTRELLSDQTQLDRERLAVLMHPDFVAHLPGGVIRTKGSILARPATLSGSIHLDVLGADHLGADYVLLRYRLKRNSQDYLCVVLWQRTGSETVDSTGCVARSRSGCDPGQAGEGGRLDACRPNRNAARAQPEREMAAHGVESPVEWQARFQQYTTVG